MEKGDTGVWRGVAKSVGNGRLAASGFLSLASPLQTLSARTVAGRSADCQQLRVRTRQSPGPGSSSIALSIPPQPIRRARLVSSQLRSPLSSSSLPCSPPSTRNRTPPLSRAINHFFHPSKPPPCRLPAPGLRYNHRLPFANLASHPLALLAHAAATTAASCLSPLSGSFSSPHPPSSHLPSQTTAAFFASRQTGRHSGLDD